MRKEPWGESSQEPSTVAYVCLMCVGASDGVGNRTAEGWLAVSIIGWLEVGNAL